MTDLTRVINRLSPAIDGDPVIHHRTGVVVAVNTDGTVDLDLGGTVIEDVPVLDGAAAGLGLVVQVGAWKGDLLVLGATRPANNAFPGWLYMGRVIFTASGTFTKATYPGLRAARICCQGPGGNGAQADATGASGVSAGSGGGGGAYAESFVLAENLDTTEAVTVGTTSGTDTVFDTIPGEVRADSGDNGVTATSTTANILAFASPGPGGLASASVGDLIIAGSAGTPGIIGRQAADVAVGGSGGPSHLGGGGRGQAQGGGGTNGGPGGQYGGGGAGSANGVSQSARTGGLGAPGICLVELYR